MVLGGGVEGMLGFLSLDILPPRCVARGVGPGGSEGFALMADMVYVTQSAARIFRALHEIVLHSPHRLRTLPPLPHPQSAPLNHGIL